MSKNISAVHGMSRHPEAGIAAGKREDGRYGCRDEDDGDEDEVGDDGIERPQSDQTSTPEPPAPRSRARAFRSADESTLPRRGNTPSCAMAKYTRGPSISTAARLPRTQTTTIPATATPPRPSDQDGADLRHERIRRSRSCDWDDVDERQRRQDVDDRDNGKPHHQRARHRPRRIADFARDSADLPPAAK